MKCLHCKIDVIEEDIDDLCIDCQLLPKCYMCGVMGVELCSFCEDWETRVGTHCIDCNVVLKQTAKTYSRRGNMCEFCFTEFNKRVAVLFS